MNGSLLETHERLLGRLCSMLDAEAMTSLDGLAKELRLSCRTRNCGARGAGYVR